MCAMAAVVAAPIRKLWVLKLLVSKWSFSNTESSITEKVCRVKALPSSVMKSGPARLPQAAK